jgi:hypothetical protein
MPTQIITRAFTAKVEDIDEDARTVVAKINTQALDRYRSVILPDGARLENYRKNPLVLFNHGGGGCMGGSAKDALPIGRNLWIKATRKELVAKTEFLPEGTLELADKVFRLYCLEYLNAWSISFDPIESGRPAPDEIKKRAELADCEVVYRVWDLLEYSCVTIPGNPEATRQAIARGLALPGWSEPAPAPADKEIPAAFLPPLAGRSMAEVQAAVVRELRASLTGERSRIVRDATELARGML